MVTHVKVVGILHIAMGGIGIVIGLCLLLFFGGLASLAGMNSHSSDDLAAVPILGAIGVFIFILIAVLSLPGIIAGIGLLQFRNWARILTIVLSVLHLFNIPFGTALGVYSLWALMAPETEAMFRRGPAAAMPRY